VSESAVSTKTASLDFVGPRYNHSLFHNRGAHATIQARLSLCNRPEAVTSTKLERREPPK
jgi:hypothetical protein